MIVSSAPDTLHQAHLPPITPLSDIIYHPVTLPSSCTTYPLVYPHEGTTVPLTTVPSLLTNLLHVLTMLYLRTFLKYFVRCSGDESMGTCKLNLDTSFCPILRTCMCLQAHWSICICQGSRRGVRVRYQQLYVLTLMNVNRMRKSIKKYKVHTLQQHLYLL